MPLFNFKWIISLFSKFSDTQSEAESPERQEGSYIDSMNMRNTDIINHGKSLVKIHGEALKWQNIDNRCSGGSGNPFPATYECIASHVVLNHVIEFWCDETNVGVPFVRIDGWVVLYPNILADFPISTAFPPQLDGNESCIGGEIFYTDDNIPPFVFNVTDLLTNSGINPANNLRDGKYTCTNKYFSGFDITQYQVQPPSQQDHPQFIEITVAGTTPNTVGVSVSSGTGGMKVGKYQYSFQYVDSTGNTTNWSEMTPQIPMPDNLGYMQVVYPNVKAFGGPGATISGLGIHIRFRVTNTNNYASINIRRTSWNVDAAVGTPANDDSVIATTNIAAGQIGIIDFYDNDNSTQTPVTTSASTQSNLSAIQAAKGIRYYQSKLTLWNITYASRNLAATNIVFNTSNGTMYPFVRPLGQSGYKDIWNNVYRQTHFRGERYGYALVAFDNTGNPTFALPIPGSNANFPSPNTFKNFQMPNRRDQLKGASLLASVEVYKSSSNPVPYTSAANSSNAVTQTYEVFDMVDAVQRGPATSINTGFTPITIIDDSGTFGVPDKRAGQNPNGYNPFRPVSDADTSQNFSYLPDASVNDGSASDPTISFSANPPNIYSGFLPYNPKGFLPNLYALGMILDGVSGLPNWVSSFAIVRTAPAKRVIAQGQGFYNFNGNANPPGWQNTNTIKDTQGFIWKSPDFETGIADANTVISNLSRYNFQVVSPLGFFTEMFSGYSPSSCIVDSVPNPGGVGKDRAIDMICYARILTDETEFNPISATPTMAGIVNGSGRHFVSFSSWRNPVNSVTPNEEFGIGYLNDTFSGGSYCTAGMNPRNKAYYLRSAVTGVYANAATGGATDYVDAGVKSWHEPLYVTNIVDDSQNIVNGLVQDYYNTGCYVKISSIIGQITTSVSTPSFILVDERWQDCIPAETSADPTANEDRYVWIQDTNNNLFAWINVTYKTAAQVTAIQTAINSNGFYVSTKCDGSTVNCYGMYSHKILSYNLSNRSTAPIVPNTANTVFSQGERFYYINFDQVDLSGNAMIPASGSLILVKYDTCASIEIFGGDAYIGEYNFAAADCQFDSSASPNSSQDTYIIDRPLPFRAFQINENTLQIHHNDPALGSLSIVGNNLVRFYHTFAGINEASYVRQLLVNGIIESRTNTALFFTNQSFFPNVNYIVRPFQWRSGKETKNIQAQYFADYGGSYYNNWGYGGFNMNPEYNGDYSEYPSADKSYSQPSSGFTEKLNYCSRCIWSDTRSTNEENTPNLRNFPSTNIYDFDDATGEIKRAWDSSNAGQQGNLYAFTESGIVMAETNKSILTAMSGGTLAEIGNSDNAFIQAEVWLSRSIGMPDQMWRSAAEYNNKIYWADKESVYRLQDNKIDDLGQEAARYTPSIKNALLTVGDGYSTDVTSVWFEKYEEYWLCVNKHRTIINPPNGTIVGLYPATQIIPPAWDYYVVGQDAIIDIQTNIILFLNTLTITTEIYIINNYTGSIPIYYKPGNFINQVNIIAGQVLRAFWNASANEWQFDTNYVNLVNDLIWSESIKGWQGQYKYHFDKYAIDAKDNIFASRYGATYLLDSGFTMNSSNVEAWVLQVALPKENFNFNTEFVRVRINSNQKPDNVYFFPTIEAYVNGNPHSTISSSTPNALKNYGGQTAPSWEGYIPRGNSNYNFYRAQGRYFLYQIDYAQANEWWLSSAALQWKDLM